MRHSRASHAIAAGMPIEIAQLNMGHASLATTTVTQRGLRGFARQNLFRMRQFYALMLTMTRVPFERAGAQALLAAHAHKETRPNAAACSGKADDDLFSVPRAQRRALYGKRLCPTCMEQGVSFDDNVYYVNYFNIARL